MQVHLISGFLGSGKTTAIQTASQMLIDQGKRVGVVMNDQGMRLVDTGFFESHSIPNRQVINGCFCCNYDDLATCLTSFTETEKTEIVFAESVGSCTDIIATVLKPLQKMSDDVQVTLSTFADARLLQLLFIDKKPLFEESVFYIFQKQLEEAGIVVVTKTDLMNEVDLSAVKEMMHTKFPSKEIIYINGREAEEVEVWLDHIDKLSDRSVFNSSLQIDYDLYGAGEALLAWLDEELIIYSQDDNAMQLTLNLINLIYEKISSAGYTIGHFKCLINDTHKLSYTATTKPENTVFAEPFSKVKLLLNARVQTHPDILSQLVDDAINETKRQSHCDIGILSESAFQPGYPTPTHRIA